MSLTLSQCEQLSDLSRRIALRSAFGYVMEHNLPLAGSIICQAVDAHVADLAVGAVEKFGAELEAIGELAARDAAAMAI